MPSTHRRGGLSFMPVNSLESLERRSLLSAGTIDTSFGNKGTIIGHAVIPDRTDLTQLTVTDAVAAPHSRTIVVGTAAQHNNPVAFLARFDSRGNLDRSFGKHGIAVTRCDSAEPSAAIDSAGRIVVALNGYAYRNSVPFGVFRTARFMPSGHLDLTFGTKGIASTDYPNVFASSSAVAIGSDGKIVVAGWIRNFNPLADPGSKARFAVVRFTASGQVDSSFHRNGLQTIDITGQGDEATAVAVSASGEIVVGGVVSNGSKKNDFGIVRLLPSGARDHLFSKNGIIAIDFGTRGKERLRSIMLAADGTVTVAGISQQVADDWPYSDSYAAIARLTAEGELDATFSGDGRNTSREWYTNPSNGLAGKDPVLISAMPEGGYRIIDGRQSDEQLSPDGNLKSAAPLPLQESGRIVAVLP